MPHEQLSNFPFMSSGLHFYVIKSGSRDGGIVDYKDYKDYKFQIFNYNCNCQDNTNIISINKLFDSGDVTSVIPLAPATHMCVEDEVHVLRTCSLYKEFRHRFSQTAKNCLFTNLERLLTDGHLIKETLKFLVKANTRHLPKKDPKDLLKPSSKVPSISKPQQDSRPLADNFKPDCVQRPCGPEWLGRRESKNEIRTLDSLT